MKEKIESLRRDQQEKLQKHNEMLNKLQREKELKALEKNLEKEKKQYNVERTAKAKEYQKKAMLESIKEKEEKVSRIKEDRDNALKNREIMRKMLVKELLAMRDGKLSEEYIREKYGGIHDDEVFEDMIMEMKKQVAPKGVSKLP